MLDNLTREIIRKVIEGMPRFVTHMNSRQVIFDISEGRSKPQLKKINVTACFLKDIDYVLKACASLY